MAETYGVYVSYEDIKQYSGVDAAADDTLLGRLCRQASARWDAGTLRTCYPVIETKTIDYQDPWELNLRHDLLELTTFLNGDRASTELVEGTDIRLQQFSGPPYNGVEILADSGSVFQYNDTYQGALSVTGVWGWHNNWADAWQDSADTVVDAPLSSSATSLTVTDADGTGIWGDTPRFKAHTLIKIESEYLFITVKNTTTNVLTVRRGVNGSTAAAHDASTAIYIYQPPDGVVQGVTRWASYLYAQKDASVFDTTTIPESGVIITPQGIPKDVMMAMKNYRRWYI